MILYLPIALVLAPWLLYTIGAAVRLATKRDRHYRDQLALAGVALIGSAFTWIHYDPNFGLDPYGVEDWSNTADIVETWIFRLAVFFFILAQIPDIKLIQYSPWWRQAGKSLSFAFIILGAGAAWYVSEYVSLPWLELPWSIARSVFSVFFIPHAIGYLASSWKVRIKPAKYYE